MITEVRHFEHRGLEQARSFETPMLEKEALSQWFQQVLWIVHGSGLQFEKVEYHFFTADGQRWLDPENNILQTRGSDVVSGLEKGYFRGWLIIRAMDLRVGHESKRATGVAYGKPIEETLPKAQELWPTMGAWSDYSKKLRAQVAHVLVKFVVASC